MRFSIPALVLAAASVTFASGGYALAAGTPGNTIHGSFTTKKPLGATVTFTVINNQDVGIDGAWAVDNVKRTVSLTRHPASRSFCSGARTCYFYTGTFADKGTFVTDPQGRSPNFGTIIANVTDGTIAGGSDVEFYADSGALSAKHVKSAIVKNGQGLIRDVFDERWYKAFFPKGTVISDFNVPNWSWTYTATSEHCTGTQQPEVFVTQVSSDTGDITGVCQ